MGRKGNMKENQFIILSCKYGIDPAIALENENLVKALKSRNDKEVVRILREEF